MYLKEFFSDFRIQNSSCKLLTLRICFYLGFNNSSGVFGQKSVVLYSTYCWTAKGSLFCPQLRSLVMSIKFSEPTFEPHGVGPSSWN